jgi:hypothetical protein
MRASELAGTGVVYMATINRDFVASLGDLVQSSDWEPPEGSTDGLDTMGEPAERITTEIDVTGWIDRKRRAMEAHGSQISETSFFLSMPPDVFSTVWGHEWYIRVRPVWSGSGGRPKEHALLLDGDDTPGDVGDGISTGAASR